jgi:hypothetical protein
MRPKPLMPTLIAIKFLQIFPENNRVLIRLNLIRRAFSDQSNKPFPRLISRGPFQPHLNFSRADEKTAYFIEIRGQKWG